MTSNCFSYQKYKSWLSAVSVRKRMVQFTHIAITSVVILIWATILFCSFLPFTLELFPNWSSYCELKFKEAVLRLIANFIFLYGFIYCSKRVLMVYLLFTGIFDILTPLFTMLLPGQSDRINEMLNNGTNYETSENNEETASTTVSSYQKLGAPTVFFIYTWAWIMYHVVSCVLVFWLIQKLKSTEENSSTHVPIDGTIARPGELEMQELFHGNAPIRAKELLLFSGTSDDEQIFIAAYRETVLEIQ